MDPTLAVAGLNLGSNIGNSAMNLWGQQNQRSWEERMANTAYQRSAADMRAAGLNPSLMFGSGGPAATPNVAPPRFESPTVGLPELAMSAAKLDIEKRRLDNETQVSNATVGRINAETQSLGYDPGKKQAETDRTVAETERTRKELPNIEAQLRNLEATLHAIRAETRHKNASARAVEADLPKKELTSEAFKAAGAAVQGAKKAYPMYDQVQPVLDRLLGEPGARRKFDPRYSGGSAGVLDKASEWLWGKVKEFGRGLKRTEMGGHSAGAMEGANGP